MNTKTFGVILIVLTALVLFGCTQNPQITDGNSTVVLPTDNNTLVQNILQSPTVIIKDLSFTPSILTISAGTSVLWTNSDSVNHIVTSDNGKFDSGTLNPEQMYAYEFTTPGTYTYHCSIHPTMKGTIIVQ